MTIEKTLSIIKPDAIAKGITGEIFSRFERKNLKIVAAKMIHLNKEQAEGFYAVHKQRPFYDSLVEFMISAPIMVCVLAGDDAIAKNRQIMGSTNPKEAAPDTIRCDFAESIERNTVHGSDSPQTAAYEINFFFKPNEIYDSEIIKDSEK